MILALIAGVFACAGIGCAYYAGARFLDALDEHDDESNVMFGGVSSSSSGRGDAPAVPAQPHTAGRSPLARYQREIRRAQRERERAEVRALLKSGHLR